MMACTGKPSAPAAQTLVLEGLLTALHAAAAERKLNSHGEIDEDDVD